MKREIYIPRGVVCHNKNTSKSGMQTGYEKTLRINLAVRIKIMYDRKSRNIFIQ